MDAKLLAEEGVRRCAAISAHLRSAPPARSGEVLAQHGLTAEQWEASKGAWTQAIEAEIAQDEHELLLAYAEEFRAVEARLQEEPPIFPGPESPAPAGNPAAQPESMPPPTPPLNPPPFSAPVCITGPVDLEAILSGRLPFQATGARPSIAEPTPRAERKQRMSSGTVVDLKIQPASLPFPAGSTGRQSAEAPELTFEQYVALCSEITVSPDRVNEILSKARIAPPALPALHASWRGRMATHAELGRRWHVLYAHYVDWFTKARSSCREEMRRS